MLRAENRIIFGFLAVSLLAFGGALLYRSAERSGKFDLDTVRINGIRLADSAAVAEILIPYFSKPLGSIDRDSLENELETLAGIEIAEASLIWPSSIRIRATLSRPVLLLSDESGTYPISADCEILPSTFISDTLPMVEIKGGADSTGVTNVVEWLSDGLPNNLCGSLVLDGRTLTILFDDNRAVILGENDLSERWTAYQTAKSCALLSGDWCEMDLRYSNQAVLRFRERL
jgi:cell division septal protein FtsQ